MQSHPIDGTSLLPKILTSQVLSSVICTIVAIVVYMITSRVFSNETVGVSELDRVGKVHEVGASIQITFNYSLGNSRFVGTKN